MKLYKATTPWPLRFNWHADFAKLEIAQWEDGRYHKKIADALGHWAEETADRQRPHPSSSSRAKDADDIEYDDDDEG